MNGLSIDNKVNPVDKDTSLKYGKNGMKLLLMSSSCINTLNNICFE